MRVFVHAGGRTVDASPPHRRSPPLRAAPWVTPDPDAIDDLVSRLLAAVAAAGSRTADEGPGHEFHGNQWTGGLGAKPDKAKAKGVKAGTHELLSSGHAFTMEELQQATGATTLKQVSDALAMLKNPKYAGAAGTLEIVKEGGKFVVKPKAAAPEPLGAAPALPPVPDPVIEPVVATPAQAAAAKFGDPVHPIAGLQDKAAADKFYAEQVSATLAVTQAFAKKSSVKDAPSIALAFKQGKQQAMAQWSANTKGHPVAPKPQEVFGADLALVDALAQGEDPKAALETWKKNTNLEKQGLFPPKPAAPPLPPAAPKPPAVELAQALTAPDHYVPADHQHVSAADFAESSAQFTKGMSSLKAQLAAGHPDPVQNKIGVQAALESRLKDSPAFQALQAAHSKTYGINSLAARLISSWAGSSGDHQPVSVANQLAVRDAFSMDPAQVSTDAYASLVKDTGGDESKIYAQAAAALGIAHGTDAERATFRAGLRDFALAQYAETQAHLKQLGVTELYLARGMKIPHAGKPDLVHMKLQPASSFSANYSTASGFSGGQSMYFSKVPASQVLSSYVTGFGCTNEHEVVVLAHPEMRAVRGYTAGLGGSMPSAAAVIAQSLGSPASASSASSAAAGNKPKLKLPSAKGAAHPQAKVALAAAKAGDLAGVQAAYNAIAASTGKYPASKKYVMELHAAASAHKAATESWHAANPKGAKIAKAAPAAGTPAPPAHHAAHSHYDAAEYAAWQAKGYNEFQLGKKLAMKKFVAKKKGT